MVIIWGMWDLADYSLVNAMRVALIPSISGICTSIKAPPPHRADGGELVHFHCQLHLPDIPSAASSQQRKSSVHLIGPQLAELQGKLLKASGISCPCLLALSLCCPVSYSLDGSVA